MLKQLTGKPIVLKCEEPSIPEFPQLLFGGQPDSSGNTTIYFNATHFINKTNPNKKVSDFFEKYDEPLKALSEAYKIDSSQICKLNHEGDVLIEQSFVFLFISFVEPNFLAYICDRMHELLSQGFAVSDTYIYRSAHNRLDAKTLQNLIGNEARS